MTCASCTGAVERLLDSLPSVKNASVSLLTESAEAEHDITAIKPETIASEIEDIGFEATVIESFPMQSAAASSSSSIEMSELSSGQQLTELQLAITGMTCATCSGAIERSLASTPGVIWSRVNLLTEDASIRFDAQLISARALIESIEEIGFGAELKRTKSKFDDLQHSQFKTIEMYRKKFLFAVTFALPTTILAMAPMLGISLGSAIMSRVYNDLSWHALLLWVMSSPVYLGLGPSFFVPAWRGLRHGSLK